MTFELLFTFIFSALLCSLVLITKSVHIKYTSKGHTPSSKQSVHSIPTPRIGGFGLFGFAFASIFVHDLETKHTIMLLSMSAIPVYLGGLAEDVGLSLSPRSRLILSFISACIAGIILDVWIDRSGYWMIDSILTIFPLSVVFTALVSGGICHSMNLIDGLNGLSLGVGIIIAAAVAVISALVGDPQITSVCLILIGALSGILIFNFPLGKLFLGDAGAYTMGHILTWVSILLMSRNPEVAPFAVLLFFFWPVAEMLFSIFRRVQKGKPVDQPDRMHFHQFLLRAYELVFGLRRSYSNPLSAATIWLLAGVPAIWAVLVYESNLVSFVLWVTFFFSFVWLYTAGVRLARFLARARRNDESLFRTIHRESHSKIATRLGGSKARILSGQDKHTS